MVTLRRDPSTLLVLMSIATPLAFAVWQALLNNFAIERAGFNGAQIGILQSLREIPGFLAFTAVFVLLIIREQSFALLALATMGAGVAITGLFPSIAGLYVTTVIMSVGFQYFETAKQSLSLQWFDQSVAPQMLGRLVGVGAFSSLLVFAGLWLAREWLALDYAAIYAWAGGLCLALCLVMAIVFPAFPARTRQRRGIVLRRSYSLYYALTFLSGARRQIFVVFAGFLLVERFGFSVSDVAALYLLNHLLNWRMAEPIGRLIGRIGERRALGIEYLGLILVFCGYALVSNATIAAVLYLVDHLFFALAIASKTYFQKIADPADIAATAGVSFTINHIAAVVLPAGLGLIWLSSPAAVFLIGAAIAAMSLALSRLVPQPPAPGREFARRSSADPAQAR